ncbi:MAG TPA: PilZ domain-containing protein [Bacillus sp. (in: firmicutes)]|nr:PilZ domain-containing protein [Bacillus sp. (in: firmicutes)]
MIREGMLLRLEPFSEETAEKFNCKVVEREADRLFVSYPIHEETGKTTFMLDGTQLSVSFIGRDNVVYFFQSEVIGRTKKTFPVIALRYPGDHRVLRIQRRQYVRVPVSVSVAIHPIEGKFSPFVTRTEDISAGGVAVFINQNIEVKHNEFVKVWLTLPMQSNEFSYLELRARVVRVVSPEEGRSGKLSLQFLDVEDRKKEKIIRFVFEQQLEMKRKGLL